MDIGCKAQEIFKRGNEARGGRDNELTNFLRRRMGRSIVAHFARKVRATDIVAAKHG